MDRNNFWRLVDEPRPDQLPASFSDIPFLHKSGRQVGDEPRLYYVLPSLICRADLSIESRLRLTRLYGAALFGLTGVIAAWGLKAPKYPGSSGVLGLFLPINQNDATLTKAAVLAPMGLVLLPMPAFIAGSVNNDGLAILTGTAVFAISARIYWDGPTRPRVMGVLVMMVLALLSKKTTLFLVPWIGIWALVEVVLAQRIWFSTKRLKRPRMTGTVRRGLVLLFASIAVMTTALLPGSPSAKGWSSNVHPFAPGASRFKMSDEESASWNYLLVDNTALEVVRVFQWIEGPRAQALTGQTVAGVVHVRSPYGESQSGCLVVRDLTTVSRQPFIADHTWHRVSVNHTVAPGSDRIQMAIAPGACDIASDTGALLIDHAALIDSSGNNVLANGGFEDSSSWISWIFSNIRKIKLIHTLLDDTQHSIDVVFFRLDEMKPKLSSTVLIEGDRALSHLRSIVLLFPGFWGNFGWLQRPLPLALYGVLAGLCGLAILGLIRTLQMPGAKTSRIIWYWILGVGLAVAQAILPMIGHDWQPQGRYLFPALFPIVTLLAIGLSQWTQGPRSSLQAWTGALFLLMFDGISLLVAARMHL
ncbi:MAG TPA: hypothetical protein VL334_08255 [Anaerolineae bacterium]|nr:hypothetical protein [Anaerolineae bacterium]